MKYKLVKDTVTNETTNMLRRTEDDGSQIAWIPMDEANTDYQEYLEWAKTNTAEEAD
tara:strand:- start:1844 stop:2014 length:171 start_codon:yes stop_codon:yes gene_type:complete